MYAEVIIPLALPTNYTWSVPEQWQSQVKDGCRVEVELRNKKYAGIVKRLHHDKPAAFEPKAIGDLLDTDPIVYPSQQKLWDWIAEYYLCSEGEVMAAALPAHFKLSSETILVFNEENSDDFSQLDTDEFIVAEALLIRKELKLTEVQQLLDSSHVYPIIKRLIEKEVCFVRESLKETYSPKKIDFVLLNAEYAVEERLAELLNNWARAPKQLELLLSYLHLYKTTGEVPRPELLKKSGANAEQLKGLVDKNILRIERRTVDRAAFLPKEIKIDFELTPVQQAAYDNIEAAFQQRSVCLLHGVTSSGKTLIYIRQIEAAIRQGRQALYLLPEIALTSQIIRRLQRHFGGYVGIYHSKFSQNERLETWNKIRSGEIKVVLGARSAIFLPFSNLGLIIADEEHDASYKQQEPAPRYHARDAAIYYASLFGARVLLGSATPAVESYYNAITGKYGLVELKERFGNLPLPEITIVDSKVVRPFKKLKVQPVAANTDSPEAGNPIEDPLTGSRDYGKPILSPALHAEIDRSLNSGRQVILFQNRRGYSPYQVCEVCGWIPQCRNCDVSLNFHKLTNKLHCHYCGTVYPPVNVCAACGNHRFVQRNFGTERIEEHLELVFPKARIARMDIDSVRGKNAHDTLIQQFEQHKVDILVGTQMVVKGLDFEHVNLVGILDADSIIHFAEFRATERAFQLMEQVSGRAGRKDGEGKVLIQAADTVNPVLGYVKAHDYTLFIQNELPFRQQFGYPPFTRIIRVTFRHTAKEVVDSAAGFFAITLKKEFPNYLVGPAEPVIGRIRNQYLMELMLKLPKDGQTIAFAKHIIRQQTAILHSDRKFRSVVVIPDVDAL
ncbi:MAG TPA: primosomal protein N' [Puia sp.]|jgi:primosomal protein N' (replication factor Y)|nr:primosomal protein N' [Puia sp.]